MSQTSDLPLKLAKPAKRALNGAGFFQLEQLTKVTEENLLKLHGIGPKALELLRNTLAEKGLTFAKNS